MRRADDVDVVGDEIGGGGCRAKARSTTQPMPFFNGIVVGGIMPDQNSGLAEQSMMIKWHLQNVKSESEKVHHTTTTKLTWLHRRPALSPTPTARHHLYLFTRIHSGRWNGPVRLESTNFVS